MSTIKVHGAFGWGFRIFGSGFQGLGKGTLECLGASASYETESLAETLLVQPSWATSSTLIRVLDFRV